MNEYEQFLNRLIQRLTSRIQCEINIMVSANGSDEKSLVVRFTNGYNYTYKTQRLYDDFLKNKLFSSSYEINLIRSVGELEKEMKFDFLLQQFYK